MNQAVDRSEFADNESQFARSNRNRLLPVADALAVAVAVAVPWSTSATLILVWAWFAVLIPTLDLAALRRELRTAAGVLPVLLFVLATIGMLWAFDVPFKERLGGLSSFYKLLFIPLFILHFRRSQHAGWVIAGYLASCGVLLAVSWGDMMFPWVLRAHPHNGGVVVRDHIAQGGEFAACALFLAPLALVAWTEGRRWKAAAVALAALCFIGNIIYIGSSRTGLVTVAALLALFAWKFLSWNARIGLLAALIVAGAVSWPWTGHLRINVSSLIHEMQTYHTDAETRAGERLVFWQKSMGFVAAAPLIGHGTGSIRDQFRRSAEGQTGMAAAVAANPHNQTLAVAIQLGLLGAAVLVAMWVAHLLLFWGGQGIAAWFGLVVVAQNIIGSLFNSHLFDFTQGWSYVLGVGVAGGAMLASGRESQKPAT
jgi:O-antigen ligase